MTTTTVTATRSTRPPDFAVDSKNHHSFSAIPMFDFKWGSQRHLRCTKHPELPTSSASASPLRKRRSSSFDGDDNDGGIEAVTKKLMLDFCAEVDELQSAFLNGGKHSSSAAVATDGMVAPSESRPWNLRSNPRGHISGGRHCSSPGRNSDDGVGGEKPKRRKFSASLTKKEIERDFVAMTGARPGKRPKKRAKSVQKQIDAMFPGFWLTEIRANMYKVNEEQPDASKR
ncbi:hypothetical protein RND81_10G093700 [Saponaria officinalis]|uniref:Uncharacterized protein n=1 Tax=Saponaria officinalis TaxID=3572 RepID=A0AAW1I2R9_SAPOF